MAELPFDRGLILLEKRTTFVKYTIFVYITASIMAVAAKVGELAGLVDITAGVDPASQLAALVYLVFIFVIFGSMFVVGMWIYRAHANLRAADVPDLTFSPGSAVGWFFVPIANFFKPFQAMRELWTLSHLQDDSYVSESDPKLTIWWGCWVVGSMLSDISARMGSGTGPNGEATALVLDILGTLVLIGAAWSLLRIVLGVNAAQQTMIGLDATFA